jgi:hypothetical protein
MEKQLTGKVKEIIEGKKYLITVNLPKTPEGKYPKLTYTFYGIEEEADNHLDDWIKDLSKPEPEPEHTWSMELFGDFLLRFAEYQRPNL